MVRVDEHALGIGMEMPHESRCSTMQVMPCTFICAPGQSVSGAPRPELGK